MMIEDKENEASSLFFQEILWAAGGGIAWLQETVVGNHSKG